MSVIGEKEVAKKPSVPSKSHMFNRADRSGEQSDQTHSLTENSSKSMLHPPPCNIDFDNKKNGKRNEAVNEIEIMNKLLEHMQKESKKRTEMLQLVFDKNFDEKIKICVDTRAEMEARVAAFEATIQSETLIKKDIKDISMENNYEEELGMNCSQTGSTSEGQISSPLEQQRSQSELAAPNSQIPVSTGKTGDGKKMDNEQVSADFMESTGKKTIKGFGEAALTKVGHWSKNAFNFFRTKSALSGKETATSRKASENSLRIQKSHGESSDRSEKMDAEIGGKSRENLWRTRRTRKVKSHSPRVQKAPRSRGATLRGSRGKDVKNVKNAVKFMTPQRVHSATNVLKQRAAKLLEAKKKLKRKNTAKNRTQLRKSRQKADLTHPRQRKNSRGGFVSGVKIAGNDKGKRKGSAGKIRRNKNSKMKNKKISKDERKSLKIHILEKN